jgi:predicted nucleotidyltransferase
MHEHERLTARTWAHTFCLVEALSSGYEVELASIVEQLVQSFAPERVILFGSCARGEIHDASDIDLLVVQQTDLSPTERIREVYRRLRRTLPLDVVVYTPQEVAALSGLGDPLLREAIAEGRVVYERASGR